MFVNHLWNQPITYYSFSNTMPKINSYQILAFLFLTIEIVEKSFKQNSIKCLYIIKNNNVKNYTTLIVNIMPIFNMSTFI